MSKIKIRLAILFTILLCGLAIVACAKPSNSNGNQTSAETVSERQTEPISERQVVDNWKVINIRQSELSLETPADFSDIYPSQKVIDTEVFMLEGVESKISVDVNLTPFVEIDKNNVKLSKLSSSELLEVVFTNHKKNFFNELKADKISDYEINGVRGVLLEKLNGKRLNLTWMTFRIFKGKMQRISIDIFSANDNSTQMKRILDSIKFSGEKKNYLTRRSS